MRFCSQAGHGLLQEALCVAQVRQDPVLSVGMGVGIACRLHLIPNLLDTILPNKPSVTESLTVPGSMLPAKRSWRKMRPGWLLSPPCSDTEGPICNLNLWP